MPFGLGVGELTLIFGIVLMVFGAKRLPEIAGGMGKGIRDFKRAVNGLDEETIQANQPRIEAPTPESEPKQLP